MPSSAEVAEEKLAAAIKAVAHVLRIICENPKVAYHLGHGTESYGLLCQAMATYKGQTLEEVHEVWEPARQTGTPTREESSAQATMSQAQIFLCAALDIPPFLATEVLDFAKREAIDFYPYIGGDEPRQLQATDKAFDLYRAWWGAQSIAA